MDDRHDNGMRPQPPAGAGYEGMDREDGGSGQQALATRTPGRAALAPLPLGAVAALCVVAGLCAGVYPVLAAFAVGMGYAAFVASGSAGSAGTSGSAWSRPAACALIAVPAIASALLFGLAGVEDAVAACAVGIVAAELYLRGRLGAGSACLAVAVLSSLLFAVSEGIARLAGTSLYEQFSLVIDLYLQEVGELSIDAQALLDQVKAIVEAIWPSAFSLIVFAEFALASRGAATGAARQGAAIDGNQPFVQFDVPLWVVGCLIAAIAALAAAQALPAYAGALTTVGGSLLCTLRLAFAVQGFAVLLWFMRSRGARGLMSAFIVGIAFYLELNMFVLTIVGVLDVWANLRRLNRGARVTIQDPAERS